MYPAVSTKPMLSNFLPELIKAEIVLSGQKFEFLNTMMNGSFFGAYRTIAFADAQQISFSFEANGPAMTTAKVF